MTRDRVQILFGEAALAAWAVFAGAGMAFELGGGLRRLGWTQFVPRIVALEVVRTWGAHFAALACALVATATLHLATRTPPGAAVQPMPTRAAVWKIAGVVLGLSPLLYVAAVVLALGGAMAVTSTFAITTGAFLRGVRDGLAWGDVGFGLASSIAYGGAAAAFVAAGRRWWAAPRGLAWKLVAVAVVAQAVFTVEEVVLALTSDW